MKKIDLLISGGGTGGHIFPAVAIANAVKKKYPDSRIEFVGAQGRMEMEKVPAAGYTIHGLWISGLQRKLSLSNLVLPFKVLSSLWRSWWLVRRFKPDATVGVGGYASGPLNYVASGMGIPLLLQEQNSYPGITNKLLKNRASRICVAYPAMDQYFPAEKLVLTGNPIRQDILTSTATREEAMEFFGLDPNMRTVLVVGGSLGARAINQAMDHQLEKLAESGTQILWQTGKSYTGEAGMFSWGVKTVFIQRMDLAYKLADVVVSRAGALSISELSALGKACIFVPLPSAAEDHQTKNAMRLVEAKAAKLCKNSEAREKLVPMVLDLLQNEDELEQLRREIRTFALPSAADEILKELEKMVEERK